MRGMFLSLVKRNKRNIGGIFVIVFLTVALGACFLESNQHMEEGLGLLEECNPQDFTFFPDVKKDELMEAEGDYQKAADQKAEKLAETYQFTWEKREYVVLWDREKTIRMYPEDRKIDRYQLVEGKYPKDAEVMIDYNYAMENGQRVGDVFPIGKDIYTISAIAVLPDQISPVVDNTGKMYDEKTQCIVVVKEDVFEQYTKSKTVNVTYAGLFPQDAERDIQKMKQDENFHLFLESTENPQILSAVNSQKTMNQIIMGFSMGILGSVTVLLLLITISGQIREEYKNLGVLKALGYTGFEVSRKYLFYFFIVGIPAVAGYAAGHRLADLFYELVFGTFSVPYVRRGIVPENLLVLAVIPTLIFTATAFLWAMIKVRRPALVMIYNETSAAANRIVVWLNKKIQFSDYLKGVRTTLLFSKTAVLAFVLFGGFALGVQIQFAYTTYHMTAGIKDLVLSEYHYENDVRFIETQDDETAYQDSLKYLCEPVRLKTEAEDVFYNLNLCVIDDKNTRMLHLNDTEGVEIEIGRLDGVVINRWMHIRYGLQKGDAISIVLKDKEYQTKIGAVSQSVYGSNIYVGKALAVNQFELEADAYNGIYTDNDIVFDEDLYLSVTSRKEMGETIERSTGIYVILSVMLFICGLVVGFITLSLSLAGVVNGNRRYIALMKMSGYTLKECNLAVIDGYRIVAVAGFVISVPYTIVLCTVMFRIISANSDIAYPVSISPVSIGCCLLLTVGIVELILWYFKRKLQKISFREIMEG